jgi:hypothetical protein
MKTIVPIFIITVLLSQCSAHKRSNVWKVESLEINYLQKGVSDEYELPLHLKGRFIKIQDSLLIITEIRKNYVGSTLNDEFRDTIILEKRVFFKRQKDNEYTMKYPSDEFVDCVQSNADTCFASESFLNLLKIKGNGVNAYLSSTGKHSKTKCILFILKENKKAVLFSENDFLLLFLTKKQ